VQPTQALILLNGEFAQEQARALATRLLQDGGDLRTRLARGLWLTTCRPAQDAEIDRLLRLCADLQRDFHRSEHDARLRCCLVLLNQTDFAYLDWVEHAEGGLDSGFLPAI